MAGEMNLKKAIKIYRKENIMPDEDIFPEIEEENFDDILFEVLDPQVINEINLSKLSIYN